MSCQRKTYFRTAAMVLCLGLLSGRAMAAEPPADHAALTGVCITGIPEESDGFLCLGSRVIRPGDVLTAQQFSQMVFAPAECDEDRTVSIRYLPVFADEIRPEATMVLSIRGHRNEPPEAEDSRLETYKNLPIEGLLPVSDPEGDALTFTLTRSPKRGEVILREDGSFLYTPKKNKVGTDSFAWTATDGGGNVSREATITIDIRKPTDDRQYADTISSDCRFQAEWLRNTGIFSGETVNGQFCFSPEESVTRGQFLAMLMQVLELPVDRNATVTGFVDESPQWLKPYLAAAMRSGIIAGYPAGEGMEFRPNQAISADEAAGMVSRALDFAVPTAAMEESALPLGMDPLTRADAAKTLYQISRLRRGSGLLGLFR